MKKFVAVLMLALLFGFIQVNAQDLPAPKKTDGIAAVKSNIVITGLVYGPKIKNSAIVNNTIMWEGQSYTLTKTGKILVRTKREEEKGAPKLTLILVDKRGAHLRFKANAKSKPADFVKPLKKRTKR